MRAAWLFPMLLVAGCAGPSMPTPVDPGPETVPILDATDSPSPSEGLLFSVDADGLQPESELPGLSIAEGPDGFVYSWSPMEGLVEHTMDFLLLQATKETTYVLESSHNVIFSGNRDRPLEGRETACAAHLVGPGSIVPTRPAPQPVPGDYLIARASGREAAAPAALLDHDIGMGAVYGFNAPHPPGSPESSVWGWSQRDGTLAAGEWMLWGGGLSGVDSSEVSSESRMGYNLSVRTPMRVVDLPATSLYCGMGFSYLQNASFHTGPPGFHVGGSLSMTGLYGSAFEWRDYCWTLDGPWPFNEASVTMDGITTPLSEATPTVASGSFERQPVTLAVEHWKGHPIWSFLGFPLAQVTGDPGEMVGCLR